MRMETVFLLPQTTSVGGIPPCLYMSCLILVSMSSGIVIVVSPPFIKDSLSCDLPIEELIAFQSKSVGKRLRDSRELRACAALNSRMLPAAGHMVTGCTHDCRVPCWA